MLVVTGVLDRRRDLFETRHSTGEKENMGRQRKTLLVVIG